MTNIDSIINRYNAENNLECRPSPIRHTLVYVDRKNKDLYLVERTPIYDELKVLEHLPLTNNLCEGVPQYTNKDLK